ncbi:unnamed protein product, partial [Allacma fusca]
EFISTFERIGRDFGAGADSS